MRTRASAIHLIHPTTKKKYSQCRLESLSDLCVPPIEERAPLTKPACINHAFLYGLAIKNKNKQNINKEYPGYYDRIAGNLGAIVFEKKMQGKCSQGKLIKICKELFADNNLTIRKNFSWVGPDLYNSWLVPPPYQHIPDYLEDISVFVNNCSIDTHLIPAYFAFQWLHIHPLSDGNGRSCRALTIALSNALGEDINGLSLSISIAQKHDLMMEEWNQFRIGNTEPTIKLIENVKKNIEFIAMDADLNHLINLISKIMVLKGTPIKPKSAFRIVSSGGLIDDNNLSEIIQNTDNKNILDDLGIKHGENNNSCLMEVFKKREKIRNEFKNTY